MSQSVRRALYKAKGLPDPGPTPSVDTILLSVLVPRTMMKGIDELADALVSHFPTRQDLVLALLEDGLRSAAQAAAEAQALKEEKAAQPQPSDIEVAAHPGDGGSLIHVRPGITAEEAMRMSARLQALKGPASDLVPIPGEAGSRATKPEIG